MTLQNHFFRWQSFLYFVRDSARRLNVAQRNHDAEKVIPGFVTSCGADQGIASACHADSSINTNTTDERMTFSQMCQLYLSEMVKFRLML